MSLNSYRRNRLTRGFLHVGRTLLPALFTLTCAGIAHAQGTMDFSGAQTLMGTFNYRNDYVGVEQWSRFIADNRYVCQIQLHAEHQRFAALWDKNLRQQGLVEAFARQRHQHA